MSIACHISIGTIRSRVLVTTSVSAYRRGRTGSDRWRLALDPGMYSTIDAATRRGRTPGLIATRDAAPPIRIFVTHAGFCVTRFSRYPSAVLIICAEVAIDRGDVTGTLVPC
jgi:hypothetical protein